MSKSTVNYAQLMRSDAFDSTEKCFNVSIRELIINAVSYGADNILVADVLLKGHRRVLVMHDGTGFNNAANILDCLHANTSEGTQGLQGFGMKGAAILLVEDPTDTELVVWSRCLDGTTSVGRQTISNDNDLVIEDVSAEWKNEIFKILGEGVPGFSEKFFESVNVAYVMKQTLAPRTSIVTDKSMQMLSMFCPFVAEQNKVRFITTDRVGDKGCDYTDLTQYLEGSDTVSNQSVSRLQSCTGFLDTFGHSSKTVSFTRRPFQISDDTFLVITGRVEFNFFSGLMDKVSKRLIRVSGDPRNVGKTATVVTSPKEHAFLYFPGFTTQGTKNVTRIQTDPVYSQVNASHWLGRLGLYWPPSSKQYFAWDMHPNIDKNLPLQRKPFPIIRVFIDEIHSQKTTADGTVTEKECPSGIQSIRFLGGIDEFAYTLSPSTCRKVMEAMILAVGGEDEDMQDIRKQFRDIVPQEKDQDELALDLEAGVDSAIESIQVVGADDKKITTFVPGMSHWNTTFFLATSGKRIYGDVTSKSDGITITRTSPGVYNIVVSPLMRHMPDRTTKQIAESEWDWSGACFPRRRPLTNCEGVTRYLAPNVKLPGKRGTTARTVSVTKGISSNPEADSSLGRPYTDMDSPEPFVQYYKNQPLVMNRQNVKVQTVKNPIIAHNPSLYGKVRKTWKQIQQTANQWSDITSNTDLSECRFVGDNKDKLKEVYGTVPNYFINMAVKHIFDANEGMIEEINAFLQKEESLKLPLKPKKKNLKTDPESEDSDLQEAS